MGHAFESALIDTLIRYHRMIGRNTLWLPGTDHASIAVSTIVDKQIKAEGKSREDLGREEYFKTGLGLERGVWHDNYQSVEESGGVG